VANDLRLVRRVSELLRDGGVSVRIFGGWAEELLGLAPPRAHRDIDLLVLAGGFERVDALIAELGLDEVAAKRFPHKRAFVFEGVLVELLLVRGEGGRLVSDFWGREWEWPADVCSGDGALPVAGPQSVAAFRAQHPSRRAA
jgi:hypothetical protein